MKRVLTVIVLASAGFAHAASADAPRQGGTLLYGISAEAPTFDCGGSDTFAVLHSVAPFYSQLIDIDLSAYPKVVGDLAKSWTKSEDGRTYTFQLHESVRFHDGSPLTAADVKASYDRYRNPPAGVISFRKAALSDIEAIEAPSPATVVFKLKAANPAMLLNLASPNDCIYSAAKLAQDPNYPARNVLGTGPFKFGESVKGSHITGIRNENYTNQPYTPAGVFLIDQWRQIGVEVEHKQVETAQYREGIRNKTFDVAVDFTNAALEDPSLTLTRYLSGAPDNPSGAKDKEIDACSEQLRRVTDQVKREALVRCVEGRVLGQVYQTPLLWWHRIVALSSRVRGWEMSASHLLGQDLGKVWLAPEGE